MDTGNNVVSGATVVLKGENDAAVQSLMTDVSGVVQFDNVEIGDNTYSLDFSAGGYASAARNNISVNLGAISDQGVNYLALAGASNGRFSTILFFKERQSRNL